MKPWMSVPAIVAALLSGCTGAPPATDSGTAGAPVPTNGPRDMLIFAAGSDLNNLIPPMSTSVGDRYVYEYTYMPGAESKFECALEPVPALYDSWEWTPDSLELTLTLREDITWADGVTVTADDVAFTYEKIADKSCASPRYGYTEDFAAPPQVLAPNKVKFSWTKPGDRTTRFSSVVSYHVPKHLLEAVPCTEWATHPLARMPVPDGPFKLAEHKANEYYVLEPNEKFTGPDEWKAKLKRVMFRVVPEYQTRLLKLKKGEVDVMEGIKVKDADLLRESNPELRFVRRGYRFMDYVAWNLKDERFQDKRVRRAMAHAVDIDAMIGRILTSKTGESYGKQAIGTITPEICSTVADVDPIKKDLAEARRLLAEAGWVDTNGNGIVDRNGKELEFTLITNRENERRMEAAQLIQADLKAIGVSAKLDFMEFNSMTERTHARNFEAVLGGWSAGLFVDPSAMWHSGEEFHFNYPSYSNPRVDELIDRGLATPDPAEAAPIWKEMQEIVYDDQPYMFLWWRDEIVAIDGRFENADVDILSLFHNLPQWEVPADKVKYPI
jgi:peptide/nickel transport system substrate-binding protein